MLSDATEIWTCPLSLEEFKDPVIAEDGHTYERSEITRWIIEHGTRPLTRQTLRVDALRPNYIVRYAINNQRNNPIETPSPPRANKYQPDIINQNSGDLDSHPHSRSTFDNLRSRWRAKFYIT